MRALQSVVRVALAAAFVTAAAHAQMPAREFRAEPSPGAPDISESQSGARPVTPAMEKKVRQFLDRFVNPDKSGAEMAALFAEDAQYYERGAVGRKEIAREVERYSRHWPYRDFRIVEISYMNADPQSDGVFVAYTVEFEVANTTRSITGKANYAALIGDLDSAPKVYAIKERITHRKSIAGLPGTAESAAGATAGSSGAGSVGMGDDERGILPWPLPAHPLPAAPQ